MQWVNQRLNTLVLDEDIDLVDNVQRGLQTRGYVCGPLSRREDGVAWFADRVRADLGAALRLSERETRPQRPRANPRGCRETDRQRRDRRRGIARIAIDAGVSTSLVHYHFASREALLAEALDYSYTRAGDARIAGELPAASHAERLRSMIDQCLPTTPALEEDWVLWVELWLRAVRHPELRPVAEQLYARLHGWFAAEIAAGMDSGEFARCDPREVADRTLALIDGFGIRTLIGDPRPARTRPTSRGGWPGARSRPGRAARARSCGCARRWKSEGGGGGEVDEGGGGGG